MKIRTQFIDAIVSVNAEINKLIDAGFSDDGLFVEGIIEKYLQ